MHSKTEELAPEYIWYGEYYNNVLNTQDINFESIGSKILKAIEFNYDESYPLAKVSDQLIGKLTLNSVSTSGKGGVQLIPPYKFDYYSKETTYDQNDSFYAAKGTYALFYACNTWAHTAIKEMDQKAVIWTATDLGIFQHYQ